MPNITLIAGAGFKDDSLIVTLNGNSRRLDHLTTDYSIGVADKITLDAKPDINTLSLEYPKKGQELTMRLDANTPIVIRTELTPDKKLTARVIEQEESMF